MRSCRLCPRDCAIDRMAGPDGARCGLGPEAWLYKELLSHGEEAPISPTWLLDLGGCSMRCRFCSEWPHVVRPRRSPAIVLEPSWFATSLARRKAGGARTISFVGGDPTVSLLGILRALAAVPEGQGLPVVWNCNGLVGPQAFAELRQVVDCWVVDLKFGANNCAVALAGKAEQNYRQYVEQTLDRVHEMAERGQTNNLPPLIIRHLLMPEHLQCCTLPIIDQVASRWPAARLNLMTTYLPFGPAADGAAAPELRRMNADSDRQEAIAVARNLRPDCLVDGRAPAS